MNKVWYLCEQFVNGHCFNIVTLASAISNHLNSNSFLSFISMPEYPFATPILGEQ